MTHSINPYYLTCVLHLSGIIISVVVLVWAVSVHARRDLVLPCELRAVMSVPESVFSCIDSQSCPCGSPVWPTKDWSTWHFNLSTCHQLWTRGKEKGRVGGKFGWRKRAMTPTRTHTCTCAKTRIEHVCQSISQCPLERLNFCPLYPQRHLNTAHWVHWQCSTSHSYSTTGSLWP